MKNATQTNGNTNKLLNQRVDTDSRTDWNDIKTWMTIKQLIKYKFKSDM